MHQKVTDRGTGALRASSARPRRRRSASVALALLGTVGLVWAAAPPAAAAPTDADLTIVQTPGDDTAQCVSVSDASAAGDLSADVADGPEAVVMTIELRTRLCNPLELKASIYSMPTTGGSWPQTLSVDKTFTIQAPGTTVVTFAKGCDNVQYDIHRGISPEWIHPDFGIMHGPLLYAHTAVVHFGRGVCAPSTTTTTAPTTSTTVAPTTTATPSTSVLGATTIASTTTTIAGTLGSTTTTPAAVAGVSAERTPSGGSPSAVEGAQLAFTGANRVWVLVTLAGALLVAGVALSSVKRRETTSA
jgi:hypothetical protein